MTPVSSGTVKVGTPRRRPRGRRVAFALPATVAVLDAAAYIGVVLDSRQCSLHCFFGGFLGLLTPTARLPSAAGASEPVERLHVAAAFTAVAVTAALTVWWWHLVVRMAERITRSRRHPTAAFWLAWVAAAVWTIGVKYPVVGTQLRFGSWASLAVEIALWTAALIWFRRRFAWAIGTKETSAEP